MIRATSPSSVCEIMWRRCPAPTRWSICSHGLVSASGLSWSPSGVASKSRRFSCCVGRPKGYYSKGRGTFDRRRPFAPR